VVLTSPSPDPFDAGRQLIAVVAAVMLGPALGACGAPVASTNPGSLCGRTTSPPATWAHVVWIWMENQSFNQVIGSSSAPFENRLANACGLATNYHSVTHPSLPNYIAATSGDTQGITSDCSPSSCSKSVTSLFTQTASWLAYEESMPSNCSKSTTSLYAPKHNPAVYYTPLSDACATDDIPMGTTSAGAFLTALKNAALPSFSFVTPNLCNDMHDCSVATGDSWLSAWFSVIQTSAAYTAGNTSIFVTWDEGSGGSSGASCALDTTHDDCHVATIVVAPSTPAGARSSTPFNHYALLGTTERMLGVSTLLGHAADPQSPTMRTAFNL
jgi:hypothetical protein